MKTVKKPKKYASLNIKELEALLDQLTERKKLNIYLGKNGIYMNNCLWVSRFQGRAKNRALITLKRLQQNEQKTT